jgi:precorrin-3B synthase
MTALGFKRGWCPSLRRAMESGDGWLVRVRPREAVITAAVARAVAEASARYGNGRIEITNRANLQIRGLRPETIAPFVAAMEAVGAADEAEGLPACLVSPLAGADPDTAPETLEILRTIQAAVARGLRYPVARGLPCTVARGLDPRAYPLRRPDGTEAPGRVDARHEAAHDDGNGFGAPLPGLPPKFGFLIDGGGVLPLAGLSLDITLRAADGLWCLNDAAVPSGEAAARALALAAELAARPRQVRPRSATPPRLGFHAYGDGTQGAVLLAPPFGQLHAPQLAALADLATRHGDGALRPTPWKSLAIAGVARTEAAALGRVAAGLGLIAEPSDPRLGIVTCAGAPACARGAADTQAAAAALAASRRADDPLLHLSGCAKGCAHPGPAAVTLVGTAGGFDLIRDGRPGDVPRARGLTLAQSLALMQSLPA